MEKFWMVWNEGNRGPEKKHLNENSARNEAERLARLNPGQKFYVLAATDCCLTRDVLWASGYDIKEGLCGQSTKTK